MDVSSNQSLDLIRRAQAGDREALNQLMDRHYGRVHRAVRARLGPRLRSRVDSGDILQQTFLQAVRSFDRFHVQSEGGLVHWLSKIAEAQIRDAADYHLRQRRSVDREQSLDQAPGTDDGRHPLVEALADDAPTPLQELTRDERRRLLEECMDRLPRHFREVLLLRDFEKVSWQEIAVMMGRPSESAARGVHQQAVQELRKMLRRRGLDTMEQ